MSNHILGMYLIIQIWEDYYITYTYFVLNFKIGTNNNRGLTLVSTDFFLCLNSQCLSSPPQIEPI